MSCVRAIRRTFTPRRSSKRVALAAFAGLMLMQPLAAEESDLQFVIVSDIHFGFVRVNPAMLNGHAYTDGLHVNQVMVQSLNGLSDLHIPHDDGVAAAHRVGRIDFVAVTGDVANRAEKGLELVPDDLKDYTTDWVNGLTLECKPHVVTPIMLTPGNHDVSNAIGHTKIPAANVDGSSMKMMLDQAQPGNAVTVYNRSVFEAKDANGVSINKPNHSMTMDGIHFVFVTIWPDSGNRAWIDADLANVPLTTPVMLFMHDYPDLDPKHLNNPAAGHPITAAYEACETDPQSPADPPGSSVVEQRAMVAWLKTHPNIVAWFHGHTNYNDMYDWNGPDGDITLHCYRLDSPMKGQITSAVGGEQYLSYQLACINREHMRMTVREVRWYPTSTFSTDTTTLNGRDIPTANVPRRDVDLQLPAVTFSPEAGFYSEPQTVSLACATPGTTIHYTTDGSDPTLTSPVYVAPLTVSPPTTIKTLAVSTVFSSTAPSTSSATYSVDGLSFRPVRQSP
jgi:hypothetical protein